MHAPFLILLTKKGASDRKAYPSDVGIGQTDLLLVAVVKLDHELPRRLQRNHESSQTSVPIDRLQRCDRIHTQSTG